ncbi:MAG: NlpC/P60 family protein [Saprospiraceae bacterium]
MTTLITRIFNIAFFLLLYLNIFGQECNYSKCNVPIFGNFERKFNWEVDGAIFDDFSTVEQGICAVELYFDHDFLSDLQISLTSPGGQTIPLVRGDFSSDNSFISRWEIKFTPCKQSLLLDTMLMNAILFSHLPKSSRFSDLYYPFRSCLEHINTGTVNGKWTLKISNRGTPCIGFFYGFKIEFCQPENVYCSGLYREPPTEEDTSFTGPLLPELGTYTRNPLTGASSEAYTSSLRDKVVDFAQKFIDTPYKYGGKSPADSFDCSGFTSYVLNEFGIKLSPSSAKQSELGRFVKFDKMQPGDLIFFGKKDSIQHVAIVIKNLPNSLICIHSVKRGVKVDNISRFDYWKSRILFARDVISMK